MNNNLKRLKEICFFSFFNRLQGEHRRENDLLLDFNGIYAEIREKKSNFFVLWTHALQPYLFFWLSIIFWEMNFHFDRCVTIFTIHFIFSIYVFFFLIYLHVYLFVHKWHRPIFSNFDSIPGTRVLCKIERKKQIKTILFNFLICH